MNRLDTHRALENEEADVTPIDTYRALEAEQAEIQNRLAPLQQKSVERERELGNLRKRQASAEAELDAAIQQAGWVEGRHLVGAATAEELTAAREARQAAEKQHQTTAKASATIRALEAEIRGLRAAAEPMAQRLAIIAAERAKVVEKYVRQIGDEAAEKYVASARQLTTNSASVVAVNMALARMDNGVQPDLLTGSSANLFVPSFNATGARSGSGALATYEEVRNAAPAAFAALKARIAADGVVIRGLS